MYSQQRPGDNRKGLSAPGFERCRVQVEERDSETITRRGEATFPPLPCGENVHPAGCFHSQNASAGQLARGLGTCG